MSGRIKVLIAEADTAAAARLADALSACGWEVAQTRDAVSATAAALRHRPGAAIFNSQLPGGGGLLALKRIRASVHTTMTPVIVIAGKDAEQFYQHGADHCLAPPLDPVAVIAWLQKRLSAPNVVMEAPGALIGEPERLTALARTELLDSPPSEPFDVLTRMAAELLGVPVALVSLVDVNRQFFKSQVGLPEPWATARETPLTHSFCQWVVAGHEELIVTDARKHPVLSHNRALHELGVIAYAGVPLSATSGDPIGSFCAIDTKPRPWSDDDLRLLRNLGLVVEACIAIGESTHPQSLGGPAGEADAIRRSLVMRALGGATGAITDVLQQGDRRLTESQRAALLKLLAWFGQHLVRLSER